MVNLQDKIEANVAAKRSKTYKTLAAAKTQIEKAEKRRSY